MGRTLFPVWGGSGRLLAELGPGEGAWESCGQGLGWELGLPPSQQGSPTWRSRRTLTGASDVL